jgi:hypothetical protein
MTGPNSKAADQTHSGCVTLSHDFKYAWDWLQNNNPGVLHTSRGAEFTARSKLSKDDRRVICFYQKGKEYSRAYLCCWGHGTNCNGTRVGMYCKALDAAILSTP